MDIEIKLTPMQQLEAFCQWERDHRNPADPRPHVAEWALKEIKRLQIVSDAHEDLDRISKLSEVRDRAGTGDQSVYAAVRRLSYDCQEYETTIKFLANQKPVSAQKRLVEADFEGDWELCDLKDIEHYRKLGFQTRVLFTRIAPPMYPERLADVHRRLTAVLCDPEGHASIHGSDADNAEVDGALKDLESIVKEIEGVK